MATIHASNRDCKRTYFPIEILNQFRPYFVESKAAWVIQLSEFQFLHWIESSDLEPCTVNRPDMAMQSWGFKAQADSMVEYLKKLWAEERDPDFDSMATVKITVNTEEEVEFRKKFIEENKPIQSDSEFQSVAMEMGEIESNQKEKKQ